MTPIRIASAKGYLLNEAVGVLAQVGITFDHDVTQTRQLIIPDESGRFELMIVRPWDVPVFVANGAADLGIVGDDVLQEQQPAVATLLELGFGDCRLVLAGPEPVAECDVAHYSVVATKYPAQTARYFQKIGRKVNITKLYGSIEIAPLTGLSDYIVDLTATGQTLKENQLHIIATLLSSRARLIANPIQLRFHYDSITRLVSAISKTLS